MIQVAGQGKKRAVGSGREGPRGGRVWRWGVGILTAALTATLITSSTVGLAAARDWLTGRLTPFGPRVAGDDQPRPVVSPTPSARYPVLPSVLGAGSDPLIAGLWRVREGQPRSPSVFTLEGDLATRDLPAAGELPDRAIDQPRTTTWEKDFDVFGRGSDPTVIRDVRVDVVGRRPAAPVTDVDTCWNDRCTPTSEVSGPTLGAEQPPRRLYVSLDLDGGQARVDGDSIGVKPHKGTVFPLTVTTTDVESLRLTIVNRTCDCDWVAVIDWARKGRTGTIRVDDGGHPYRTTAHRVARRYCGDSGNPRGYADLSDPAAVRELCTMRVVPDWLVQRWRKDGVPPATVDALRRCLPADGCAALLAKQKAD